ncbi:hypothetical protein C8255_19760 [filamentous cyanobacterium CCP3]|nr:hypothetical protein C8255_19760 [filamentous cyanobacterium CCP3]
MKNQKIHPIWWLIGFSVFIGLANHDWNGEVSAPTNRAEALTDAINGMTDLDAHGDMTWRPQYAAAMESLDTNCSEPLSDVLRLAYSETQKRGEEGSQFAILNELEDTVYMIEQSNQSPVLCAPLIGQSSY